MRNIEKLEVSELLHMFWGFVYVTFRNHLTRKMMNNGLPTFSLASLEWVKNSEVSTKASSTPRPSSRKYRLLFKLPHQG